MSVKEIFDKDNATVRDNAREAHEAYISAINAAREKAGMTTNDLTIGASASPAQTYRVLNPNENVSLLSLQRFAAPVGKKVVLSLVDLDN